ncbi:hypothetical protein LINGRAHAP2_LOCUS37306 [Linum grandiflorum]
MILIYIIILCCRIFEFHHSDDFVVIGFGIVSKTGALCTKVQEDTGRVTRVIGTWRNDFDFRGSRIP